MYVCYTTIVQRARWDSSSGPAYSTTILPYMHQLSKGFPAERPFLKVLFDEIDGYLTMLYHYNYVNNICGPTAIFVNVFYKRKTLREAIVSICIESYMKSRRSFTEEVSHLRIRACI